MLKKRQTPRLPDKIGPPPRYLFSFQQSRDKLLSSSRVVNVCEQNHISRHNEDVIVFVEARPKRLSFRDDDDPWLPFLRRRSFFRRCCRSRRSRWFRRHPKRLESRGIRGRRVQHPKRRRKQRRRRRERVANQHAWGENKIRLEVLGESSVSGEVVRGERRKRNRGWRTTGDFICESGEFDARCD